VLVAQLEHQSHTTDDFTLQKLHYYISSSMETMHALNLLVISLYEHAHANEQPCNGGGAILSILADRMVCLGG
jgi:hypothetical protein